MNLAEDAVGLDLPAKAQYLSILSAVIESYLEPVPEVSDRDATVYNLKLAAQECCANMIDHAYAGQPGGRIRVRLSIENSPRRMVIDLRDTGAATEPAALAEPELQVGSIRGYGLYLMHQLMDEVSYDQDEEGNHWRLVKQI